MGYKGYIGRKEFAQAAQILGDISPKYTKGEGEEVTEGAVPFS